ncbi:GNAT family N-acetyltransferase [Rhizobium leguminosarum]|uniref:GNAT family N-acetyltransferase n=1 Tax=Rhizobium leguminosarum TaxID=384 RepID=UPI003ED13F7F
MNEPRFSNDEGEDAWIVVQVSADEHWNAYHDIRRTVLFEVRGLTGYDANHPDDRRDGYFPLLLLLKNTPVGAARLDLMDDAAACVRAVASRAECQGKGYGRMLMAGLENSHQNTGSRDWL